MSRVTAFEDGEVVYDSQTSEQPFPEWLAQNDSPTLTVHIDGTMGAETSPEFPIHEKVEE